MNAVTRGALVGAAALIPAAPAASPAPAPAAPTAAESTHAVLERFARDYEQDPLRVDVVFGIRVGGESWHVSSTSAREGGPAPVILAAGEPAGPTFVFTLDRQTLDKIDRGEWTAGTAMGKARESDPAPMDVDTLPGFKPTPEFQRTLLAVVFHFWNRGVPEVTRFGDGHTRLVHGGDVTVLHYQPGFRSAWLGLKRGQHVNVERKDQVNAFPSVLVVTRGCGWARIGGRELEVREGQSMLIPAGVSHEFWNDRPEPLEGVLMMFGAGA